MKKLLASAALLASTGFATVAGAQAYQLSYSSPNAPTFAQINITTSTTLNSVGGYDILSASGFVGSDAITGVITNPTQPNPYNNGAFIYDNVFYPTAPALSNSGLYVGSASFQYNLFSDSPTVFELYQAVGGSYTQNSVGTLSVRAVPEPATWAMMVLGFGMVGFGLRRRAKQSVRVTYA